MRTIATLCLAATALVAQTSQVVDHPQLAGALEPLAAAQFLLPFHGFAATQLAYAPMPHPALRAGAVTFYAPDPLLCSANYVGDEVAQLVFALPQGALVLLDASSSLALHVLAVPPLTWSALAGICIDGEHEQVVLLDAAGPNLLRIDLADLRAGTAQFQSASLPPEWSTVRGIAFDFARDRIVGLDPATGVLLQHSAVDPNPRAGLLRPVPGVLAFCFAPVGSSDHDLFVSSGDQRMLTTEWTWNASGIDVDTATLRAAVATSLWSPPSPDPAAVTYDSLYDRLVVSDSEVDEMPIYAGANVFEASRTGIVARTSTTVGYSNEPSGITFDSATRTFFICDDDKDKIHVLAAGPDGLLHTADDSARPFSVRNFCLDAESLAFDAATGALWIAGGAASLVHKLQAGSNGIFDGTPPNGDDVLVSFDTTAFGVTELGGIAIRPSDGGIYVLGLPMTRLLHMNALGQLVRTITLPSTALIRPAGFVFAPSTVGAGDSMFLVDRGHDNDVSPNENDGLLLEYGIPSAVPTNQPPVVNAGPDVTIASPAPANLAGTVSDDGLPGGPLTIQWSLLSGPGTATFTAPTQAATIVSFSAVGSYTCQLSAFDGALTTTDTVVVAVQPPSTSTVVERTISISQDDAEESPTTVNRSSTDLELVVDGALTQVVGIRFQNIAIPPSAVITSAHVQFTTNEAKSTATQLTIAGQASDNAPGFLTSAANISSRTRTTATVAWTPVPWTIVNEAGPNQRTPDLASIVQEIVNRPGWGYGNAMVFVITGTGCRTASAYDHSPAVAAKLTVNYQTAPPVNQPPVVNAGPDVTISITASANLAGSVSDDGLPGPLTIQWSKLSGPGTATFTAPTQAVTNVSFSAVGSYTCQLSAFDGEFTRTDTVVVTVHPANLPPVVNAGPDVTILNTASASLAGSVSDDGLNAPMTIQWTKLSGPGTATFTAPTQAVTNASFSAAGSYTLQLSAFDGELTSADTVVVTVQPSNQAPVVNAGPDVASPLSTPAHLAGTASDDGLPGPLTIQWSKLSGPGTATFTAPAQAVTNVSFSAVGSYTLQLSAFDGELTSTDTVVVTVQPSNQPPVVDAGPDVTILITASANLAGTASDDGLPGALTIQWSKLSGPGTATFTAPTQAVTSVAFSVVGNYTLQLSAFDGELTSTDTVVVTVQSAPAGSGTVERTIAISDDDAEESSTGSVNRTSSDLEMVLDGTVTQVVGIRFQNLTIPAGAFITSAYVQFTTDEVKSASTELSISGQASDNAPVFTGTATNISSRPRTTASVAWAPVPWTMLNEVGPNQRTPNLAGIVQQIVSRPGWASGNALAFVITGTGCRNASAFDRSAAVAPKLTVVYQSTPPANQAPVVNAGPDVTKAITTPAHLVGNVSDDGLPGPLTIQWSKLSGPGTATFTTPTQSVTDVSFSATGVYNIQLTVFDGQYTSTDTVTVTVPVNQPPIVNAGPDVTVASTSAAHLAGSISDDGLNAPLTIQWSKLTGPGTVSFTAPTQAVTNATFSAAGSYNLQLSAFDGEFTRTDTVVVTVQIVNQPPVVNAGPDVTVMISAGAHLVGTVTDDGLPGGPLAIQWSKVSGPGTATFTTPAQAATDVSFSGIGVYTLMLSASDGALTRTDSVVVTVDAGGSIVRAIATGHDDAEELATSVTRGSISLEMVVDGTATQVVGLRFQNIAIPQGAVITSAYVQFTAKGVTTAATQLSIRGHATDNAPSFLTTAGTISNRPSTVATAAWTPAPWTITGEAGIDQRTPDLASIVQEITSRPLWVAGNSLVFVITGTGTRTASAYDDNPALAAQLVVNYQ